MAGDTSGTTRDAVQTPTWAVAGVCAVIIIHFTFVGKDLHKLGTVLYTFFFAAKPIL